ncbi:hypothetical protein B7R54_13520 [Subtercola boreus]|uniref:Glucose/Sorbosone dehydrogenase domain-containing protein n=1 Tax=Subtercola boreus TaxID=120213 RepID=A0A3E0VMJ8_9MICO|nr:PQQ-dependent sugar dehydrogenase [Subtercola boreus]RFA10117.1 hypothetical protein B7R54_13520 [Subtercola boreus]TQL52728.1 glucose/arabinose dehydrogenase [Subtercola boreus]
MTRVASGWPVGARRVDARVRRLGWGAGWRGAERRGARRRGAFGGAAGFGVAVVLAVSGCTGASEAGPGAGGTASAAPTTVGPSAAATAPATDGASAGAANPWGGAGTGGAGASVTGAVHPEGDPATVADELDAPWSIVTLPGGTVLVDERGTGVVKEIRADGSAGAIGTVPGVAAAGEGGLLGLAAYVDTTGVLAGTSAAADGGAGGAGAAATSGASATSATTAAAATYLYAYLTTASDNRVVRMPLEGGPGAFSLGAASDVLTGIPKASNHNGGRILFGPDGMLYITAGDANQSANAQRVESLSGKILRVTPTGAVPGDNPFAGSPVYSLGHRNSQGMAWSSDGTMYAAEFGQNTWDELNVITPGANYGWPGVEGFGEGGPGGTVHGFTNPIVEWSTDEASPSGLAMVGGTLFMAGLGGERLWSITPGGDTPALSSTLVVSYYAGTLGRIRDVVATADGTGLLLLTNNTDGRGSPQAGDDRLARVALSPGAS